MAGIISGSPATHKARAVAEHGVRLSHTSHIPVVITRIDGHQRATAREHAGHVGHSIGIEVNQIKIDELAAARKHVFHSGHHRGA